VDVSVDEDDFQPWRDALDQREALAALVQGPLPAPPAVIGRLRERLPRAVVAALTEVALARRRVTAKWPSLGDVVADREGVEQACPERTALHTARRFAALDPAPSHVIDLCSGIGVCAWALGRAAPVLAVDASPLRAWMTRENAGCAVACADVTTLRLRGRVVHIDPSRRAGGRRRHRYADYRPGPAFLAELLEANPDGALRLGPGVDFAELPDLGRREVEVVAEPQGLVQATLWSGRLALHPGQRTATRLPEGASLTGVPGPIPSDPLGRYLFAVDPVVERADLVGALAEQTGLGALHPEVGLLTGDARVSSPWLLPFEVLADMPWKEKRARAWLREHGAGQVEVKTRGVREDAGALQRRLQAKLRGDEAFVLFLVRLGRSPRALLARRLTGEESST
jgi:hypothetical protein